MKNENVNPVSALWLVMCLVTLGMAIYAMLIEGRVTTGIALLALALSCRNAVVMNEHKGKGHD